MRSTFSVCALMASVALCACDSSEQPSFASENGAVNGGSGESAAPTPSPVTPGATPPPTTPQGAGELSADDASNDERTGPADSRGETKGGVGSGVSIDDTSGGTRTSTNDGDAGTGPNGSGEATAEHTVEVSTGASGSDETSGRGDSNSQDETVKPGGSVPVVPTSADCTALVTDPSINWRESALQTDQAIVECLAESLGRPVGYGENARGGYDPNGDSSLIVITKDGPLSVEEQLAQAVSGDAHAWIVFDKVDFAQEFEIGMYRIHCGDAAVLDQLQADEAECRDHRLWCQSRGYSEGECLDQFFNVALNDGDLPIRNPVIGSNKTIDGRMSEAYFRFSGFAIGADSSGEPTQTASSVILAHLSFLGAGHTEDHALDPDMIRSTGASHDIWIHKNSFELTGDSAFDVKVGAYDITMSFNRVIDVKRASLHGSSDSRTINEQITTTMHHNAFVTRDNLYETFGNTGRRVPLIRRGTSHMWNNVFVNYRKELLSVRVGASVLWQDNALVVNERLQEKATVEDSLAELKANLIRDIADGNFRAEGTELWFSDERCNLNSATRTALNPAAGSVEDLSLAYSQQSRAAIEAHRMAAEQLLVDYVSATAGKYGPLPFNSPLSVDVDAVVAQGKVSCQ